MVRKGVLYLVLMFMAFGCGNASSGSEKEGAKSGIVGALIEDVAVLPDLQEKMPIAAFKLEAKEKAAAIIQFDKNRLATVLLEAKSYTHCFITVENHTLVEITDLENTLQSGSWNKKMPMAKGFVSKNGLQLKEDYLNNIIGIPDSQIRTAYFFK